MKRGDYVVAVDTDRTDPAWDIGIVQMLLGGSRVYVRWLLADETYCEPREDVRKATHEEYNYAREEKGIDR